MLKKTKKKSKIKRAVCYAFGSAVVCTAAIILIPIVAPTISGSINKAVNTYNNAKKDDDDWGAEFVKKDNGEEEQQCR